jgi:hypothetical protein
MQFVARRVPRYASVREQKSGFGVGADAAEPPINPITVKASTRCVARNGANDIFF